jgi:hypothetical protein
MNTWDTMPESYKQRVYKNTLAKITHQIQQAGNLTPATVINMEAARVDNAILLEYLTSEVALEELVNGSADPNIPIDNNCTYDELHFGLPWGCDHCEGEGDEIDESDTIATASRRRRAATEHERFDLTTSDVDRLDGDDGVDADAD